MSYQRQEVERVAYPNRGFTLLEVLVALSLCSVITVLAYQSLQTASDSAELSRNKLSLVTKLDHTWSLLERDLQHAVAIPVMVEGFQKLAFMGQQPRVSSSDNGSQQLLSLSRLGWRNSLEHQRSELQRIIYRFSEGQLYRQAQSLEKSELLESRQGYEQSLIDKIDSISIRFLAVDSKGLSDEMWLERWPKQLGQVDQSKGLPLALEIKIEHSELGLASRLFYLPAAVGS